MPERTIASPWTALIDDMVAGRWVDPETGRACQLPYRSIVIADDLAGAEAELVAKLGFAGQLAVVSDEATHAAMGARIEKALARIAGVTSVILRLPHANEAELAALRAATRHADALVAVGTGTITDLVKYVTCQDGRPFCVFATAPSMNGYTSTTASIRLANGLKVSLPAHAARGVFVDLAVAAEAPPALIAAGFGDCMCRSVAQIDGWLGKRLRAQPYHATPFLIQAEDETIVMAQAAALATGSRPAIASLYRLLILGGLGVSFTGTTHHASMGEHLISHYIDCFAGSRHPGSLHGQQVGVATLTMARLQSVILAAERPPVLRPTVVDEAGMRARYGAEILPMCQAALAAKALDADSAGALNRQLEALWPSLREELRAFAVPVLALQRALAAAGGPTDAGELGLEVGCYREAVRHAREIRDRYTFLDLAADAGLLDDFAAKER